MADLSQNAPAGPSRAFVWPPSGDSAEAINRAEPRERTIARDEALTISSTADEGERGQAPAAMAPDAEAPDIPVGPVSPPRGGRAFEGFARHLLFLESAFLGGSRSPLLEGGFTPDIRGAYCTRCGGSTGPHETDAGGCGTCRGRRLPWDRAIRLGEYDGVLRESIHDLKYRAAWMEGARLGRMLGGAIRGEMEAAGVRRAIIVPVPTPSLRRVMLNSGVDHTLGIARAAAREAGLPIVRALRTRPWRVRQTGLTATARARNAAGAYRVAASRRLGRLLEESDAAESSESGASSAALILIDDVRTTGATLGACCRRLRRALWPRRSPLAPRIWVAVPAVAAERRAVGDRAGKQSMAAGGTQKSEKLPHDVA